MSRGLTILLLSVVGCSGADARATRDTLARSPAAIAPGKLAPSDRLDTVRLQRAFQRASELPRMRSLLVYWRGQLVREAYFHGATPRSRANIKSASKSVMSALVGIAIAQGHIRGLDQSIGELLPTETRGLEQAKRAITVEDLLTMRAGLQSTSFENYGRWVTSRNWVRFALQQPLVADRGESGPMIYSTGSTHLLSAILTRATKMSTYEFARGNLAGRWASTCGRGRRTRRGSISAATTCISRRARCCASAFCISIAER